MFLKKLKLHNFRNFSTQEIAFDGRINSFVGKNGQGKSNLLEAIYLISTGKSFRNAFLNDLIKEESSFFWVSAEIEKDDILQTFKFFYSPSEKKIEFNASEFTSFTPLLGCFPSIIISNSNNHLISFTPLLRRKFLNIFLAQSDPLYVHHLLRFTKALKQRNTLLKKKDLKTIALWDLELAKSAIYLTQKRQLAIYELNNKLGRLAVDLALDLKVSMEYLPSMDFYDSLEQMQNKYLEKLAKNRAKELLFSSTLFGPHRDDVSIKINNFLAKNFSSEGQKTLFCFLLAMAEFFLFKEKTKETPWICFDDFGQNLDQFNQEKIKSFLQEQKAQVFVTSPNEHNFGKAVFTIDAGKVQEMVSNSLT